MLRGITVVQFCGEEPITYFIVEGCALAKQLCRLSWVALLGVGLLASVCQPVTASLSQGTNGGTVSTNSDQLRWPRSVGQVGGEDKLFPGSDYAASFRLDAVAGAGPGDGVEPIS